MLLTKLICWLVPVYFGLKGRWLTVFFLGLLVDLVAGGLLGVTSLKFLGLAGLIYLVKELWPLRSSEQLHLKLDYHEES